VFPYVRLTFKVAFKLILNQNVPYEGHDMN